MSLFIKILNIDSLVWFCSMNYSSKKENTTSIVLIAIMAALALLGVVIGLAVVTIPLQEAEAGCERGFPASAPAFNASSGRCFQP
jgi:hypothetical protein